MKRLLFMVAILGGSITSKSAQADIDVKTYREMMKTTDGAMNLNLYVTGVARGTFWGNSLLETRMRKPLYCFPDKLTLDSKLVESLLEQELRAPIHGKPYADDDYIEMIVVYSLIHRFPCSTSSKLATQGYPESLTQNP